MVRCAKGAVSLVLSWLIVCASVVAQEPAATPEPEAELPDRPAVSMIEPTGDAARYWPRWRGPSGQGIVSGEDYPVRWSASENVLWRVPVPGLDNTSPIVWGDKVFVTTSESDGEEQPRSVLCYRTTDGKLLWQTYAPKPEHHIIRRQFDLSIGTPVTDGDRVYAYLGTTGLMAVSFGGTRVWHRNLGKFDHATSSPLLYKDSIVILQVSPTRNGSYLAGFNKENGQPTWQTHRKERFASGSPIAIRVGDEDQIVVSGEAFLRGYDAATGKLVWGARGTTKTAIPTPVVGYGMVFTTSGRAGPTMAVHPTGEGDVTGSHIAWKATETGPSVPSPVFYGGYLFVVDDSSGKVSCLNGSTGEVVWSRQIADSRSEGLVSSPVIVEDKLFVTDLRGDTLILRAGPEFELLGSNRLEAKIRSSPALAEGRWYFRSDRELIAIGHP